MAEQTSGIMGFQKKRQDDATSARNAGRSRLKTMVPYVIFLLMVLIPLLWWWRSDSEPDKTGVAGKEATTITETTLGADVTRYRVTNARADVWSAPIEIPACKYALAISKTFGLNARTRVSYVSDPKSESDWVELGRNQKTDKKLYAMQVASSGPAPATIEIEVRQIQGCVP